MSAAPDTPVVFIHIAKTAGTSLTRVLQEHLPADRLAVRTHRPLATLPTADHARTVAVIREPLDRLVSAFAWLGGRPSVLWRGAVGNPDLAAELGLDRFAGPADFLDHFDAFYDDHVRPWADGLAAADRRLGDLMAFGHFNLFVPQHRYLVDARDDLAVGHLLRFEHLADDTAAWLDRVAPGHGPIVWPHLYPSRREPAAALASPRALAAVRDIYAADYALPGMAPSPAPIAAREPSPGLPPLARAVARAAAAAACPARPGDDTAAVALIAALQAGDLAVPAASLPPGLVAAATAGDEPAALLLAWAWEMRAVVQDADGRRQEAIISLCRAVAAHPDGWPARVRLAGWRLEAGDRRVVLEELRRLKDLAARRPEPALLAALTDLAGRARDA